jgi:16S rRNA (uracil1498-N3)-methyltransferase
MLPRFLAPELDPAADHVTLPAEESHHLTRVLRLGAGDEVAVFDGRGRECHARVDLAARGVVRRALLGRIEPAAEPRVPITLVQAVLKGDGMDAVVRDATMLGVTAIAPVLSSHVAVKHRAVESGKAVERWRRIALASAKQCRRATLPVIEAAQPFAGWCAASREDLRLLLVEPSAGGEPRSLHDWLDAPAPSGVAVIVGPEGGWDAAEIEMAIGSGCVPVTLGSLTLRADAAPLAALAVCRFVFDR